MKGTVNEVGCMGKKWKVWLKCMCKGMRKAGIREWEAPVGLVFLETCNRYDVPCMDAK